MNNSDHKRILLEYMLSRVQLEDWHGVSDAANDMRVLEAKEQVFWPSLSLQHHIEATKNKIVSLIKNMQKGEFLSFAEVSVALQEILEFMRIGTNPNKKGD